MGKLSRLRKAEKAGKLYVDAFICFRYGASETLRTECERKRHRLSSCIQSLRKFTFDNVELLFFRDWQLNFD